jgi:hypothetical protein
VRHGVVDDEQRNEPRDEPRRAEAPGRAAEAKLSTTSLREAELSTTSLREVE